MSRRVAGEFSERYGPWALVAGGSQGLGACFAEALAACGLDLVLVARGAEALAAEASRLREGFAVQVVTVAADLGTPQGLESVEGAIAELDLGLLVYNAAVSHTGGFLDADLELYQALVSVNCRGALELCYRLGGRFVQRGKGGLLIMSSLAGTQGSPWVTAYGASKAFLLSLGEGLAEELGPKGVDVTVVCAGPILTPNYVASKTNPARRMPLETSPQRVVRAALRALGRKPVVIPGILTRAAHLLMSRLLPRRRAVAMMGRSTGNLYGGA